MDLDPVQHCSKSFGLLGLSRFIISGVAEVAKSHFSWPN